MSGSRGGHLPAQNPGSCRCYRLGSLATRNTRPRRRQCARHAEKEFNRYAKHTSCDCVASGHVGRHRLLLLAPTWLRWRKVLRTLRARLRILRRPAYGRVWSRRMSGRQCWWGLRRRLWASKLRPLPMLPDTRLLRHPSGGCRAARRPGRPADGTGDVPVLHGTRPARFLRRSSAIHRTVTRRENQDAALDSACTDNAERPTIRLELVGPCANNLAVSSAVDVASRP